MTDIKIYRDGDGRIIKFTLDGHAGPVPSGENIVCAALSGVVWTVINGLENVLNLKLSYVQRDGYVSCELPELEPKERERADILLESMVLFIEDLEKQYKNYISKTEV